MNLPMVFIYKFCTKEIEVQPPGEPREQHLGEVQAAQKFNINNHHNFFSESSNGI